MLIFFNIYIFWLKVWFGWWLKMMCIAVLYDFGCAVLQTRVWHWDCLRCGCPLSVALVFSLTRRDRLWRTDKHSCDTPTHWQTLVWRTNIQTKQHCGPGKQVCVVFLLRCLLNTIKINIPNSLKIQWNYYNCISLLFHTSSTQINWVWFSLLVKQYKNLIYISTYI